MGHINWLLYVTFVVHMVKMLPNSWHFSPVKMPWSGFYVQLPCLPKMVLSKWGRRQIARWDIGLYRKITRPKARLHFTILHVHEVLGGGQCQFLVVQPFPQWILSIRRDAQHRVCLWGGHRRVHRLVMFFHRNSKSCSAHVGIKCTFRIIQIYFGDFPKLSFGFWAISTMKTLEAQCQLRTWPRFTVNWRGSILTHTSCLANHAPTCNRHPPAGWWTQGLFKIFEPVRGPCQ